MRKRYWYLLIAASLILASVMIYVLHYAIFHDTHHVFIYMVGDLAFLPLEVLLVTVILDELLTRRDKRIVMEKMNMVIGVFFSEMGTSLLRHLSCMDSASEGKREVCVSAGDWGEVDFHRMEDEIPKLCYTVDARVCDIEELREFLLGEREFMLRLIENPMLLEHESFTDLLWAVFHLTEELANRGDLSKLPDSDYAHLSGDMERVYSLLVEEWVRYLKHLKESYPYLFSLAVRLNPFDPDASAVVD
jgi:hypothetical protein